MNRRSFLKRFGLTTGAILIGVGITQQSPIPKRKLKTMWTHELEQDLKGFHGIDVNAEIARIRSEEIRNEIDNEILKILRGESQYGKNIQKMRFEYNRR